MWLYVAYLSGNLSVSAINFRGNLKQMIGESQITGAPTSLPANGGFCWSKPENEQSNENKLQGIPRSEVGSPWSGINSSMERGRPARRRRNAAQDGRAPYNTTLGGKSQQVAGVPSKTGAFANTMPQASQDCADERIKSAL